MQISTSMKVDISILLYLYSSVDCLALPEVRSTGVLDNDFFSDFSGDRGTLTAAFLCRCLSFVVSKHPRYQIQVV